MPNAGLIHARSKVCLACCEHQTCQGKTSCRLTGEVLYAAGAGPWSDASEMYCPSGLWVGVIADDMEQIRYENRQTGFVGLRQRWKPVLKRLLREAIEGLSLPAVRAWVNSAIDGREMFLWVATEIVKELGALAIGVPANAYLAVAQDGAQAIYDNAVWGGNDPAYYALQDCWETEALTGAEAQQIAAAIGITEPLE